MAANQAAQVTEDVNVEVIPSKTIPQGYTALMMFNENATVEDNTEEMTQAISEVKSGQVTYAVRDTEIDGFEIRENDYVRSDMSRLNRFKALLESKGINTTIRRTLGADISASCGQLRQQNTT